MPAKIFLQDYVQKTDVSQNNPVKCMYVSLSSFCFVFFTKYITVNIGCTMKSFETKKETK